MFLTVYGPKHGELYRYGTCHKLVTELRGFGT